MVGMEMGHEHQVERLEADAGIDDPARDAEAAIDDDGAAAEFEQRRCRRRPARPDCRPALAAEQHQPVAQEEVSSDVSRQPNFIVADSLLRQGVQTLLYRAVWKTGGNNEHSTDTIFGGQVPFLSTPDDVERGETIMITRHGRPIARLDARDRRQARGHPQSHRGDASASRLAAQIGNHSRRHPADAPRRSQMLMRFVVDAATDPDGNARQAAGDGRSQRGRHCRQWPTASSSATSPSPPCRNCRSSSPRSPRCSRRRRCGG